jgi:serine/threonine protein kinase
MNVFESPSVWNEYGHSSSPTYSDGTIIEYCNMNGVYGRIGSDSTRAMVFKTKYNPLNKNVAVKVLLATEYNPIEKNLAEIEITKYLGLKYPEYFTIVYDSYPCNVKLPTDIINRNLVNESMIWNIRTNVLPKVMSKRDIKILEIKYRNTFDPNIYLDLYPQSLPYILPALLMYSELGYGDLKQWSINNTDENIENSWNIIIDRVLEALDILKQENITHNDLHHGNILLMNDGLIKIIDFGEYLNYYVDRKDLDKFIEGFNYIENLPVGIRNRIDTL